MHDTVIAGVMLCVWLAARVVNRRLAEAKRLEQRALAVAATAERLVAGVREAMALWQYGAREEAAALIDQTAASICGASHQQGARKND